MRIKSQQGSLTPALLIKGTNGSETQPLPDLPEAAKLSVLKGLGYTLAVEDRVGELTQFFLLAEEWRNAELGNHLAFRPQHDPDRLECLMVYRYQAAPVVRRMVVYEVKRDPAGEPVELEAIVPGFARGSGHR